MNYAMLSVALLAAVTVHSGSAIACGSGDTAAEHATATGAKTLSQLRGSLRAIKNNHRSEKGAKNAIAKLRAAIAKRVGQCRRESQAAYQLRSARQRGASRFTAGYIPKRLCI